MGFMDKFKDAAQQAQDAAKAAGGSVASMGGMGGAAIPPRRPTSRPARSTKPQVGGAPSGAARVPGFPQLIDSRSTATSRRSAARSSSTWIPTTRSRCCSGARREGGARPARVLRRALADARRSPRGRGGRAAVFLGAPGAELDARIEVRDRRAYRWALRGSTGLGEGYVEGLWATDDLVSVIRIACRNLPAWDRWRRRIHPLVGPLQRAVDLIPRNTRAGAAANISAHYDLGNELFESFLDRRLIYSCAYFPETGSSLDDAQLAKLERICDRLELGPDDHVLEIGTGWGGFAIHAATTRGCRVTTTTISREQYAYAVERVHEAGLDERVEVLLRDYRDLSPGPTTSWSRSR